MYAKGASITITTMAIDGDAAAAAADDDDDDDDYDDNSPNIACDGGFLLILYRITFVDQDLLSWPTCLDLPRLA